MFSMWHITFCRCMFLVSCSSNIFCSFLFISLRFSSPGFTRSLRTEPRPPRSPWELPWPPTALPDTSAKRKRYWANSINQRLIFLSYRFLPHKTGNRSWAIKHKLVKPHPFQSDIIGSYVRENSKWDIHIGVTHTVRERLWGLNW